MKGTINLHDKWGWGVINHTDESIPDWIPLHPDDLTHFAEMKEKFDNFESRVLSSPEVEFETIIHPKFTGRIIYAKLIPKEEPKQETLEEDLLDTAIQVVGSNNVTTIREFLVKHKSQQERMKQDFIYVATWDGIPVLGAPNRELLEQALNEYNNDTPIRYEAYNPKYPDDLEGWYYYKDPQTEGEECRFSVRCIEFKGE
jgi:hypothetical protein